MKIIGWCTTFGLGLLGATSLVSTGCSSTTTTDNTDDSGVVTPEDAGDGATTVTDDSSTTVTPDGATEAAVTTDGGTCSVSTDTSNPTCDTCLEAMCCTQLEGCFGSDPDATATSCEMLVGCIQDAEAGNDASAPMTPADALALCNPDSGSSYTATDVTNATAFLSCLGDGNPSGACATSCAQ
jgi:hypothetical protein